MTTATKVPPAVVLLVEDDLGDQVLTQEAFGVLKVPHQLHIVSDGKEALEYLYRKGEYAQVERAPRPDLILLDLNMPRVSGQQVAAVIHADANLRDIPIVILTTSRREEDVVRAYSRGVTGYIGKPIDFQHFVSAIQELEGLIKFVVTLKGQPARLRISNRQIARLARRKQQLAQRAERLFDRHIERIIGTFQAADPQELAEDLTRRSAPEASAKQALIQLARRILEGRASDKAGAADAPGLDSPPPARTETRPEQDEQPYVSSLHALARRLRELDEAAAAVPAPERSRAMGRRRPKT